jgi:hypothetical protein
MCPTKVSPYPRLVSIAIFLFVSMISTQTTEAQAPVPGTSVSVRMLEAVDSGKDPAGKQYRASVTKAVDAGNGVIIPQGAAAAVTLVNSGSGWTTQLVSVTVNGQLVVVASAAASVTSAAQSAAGSAVSAVGSVLGGFGHHVNAPSGVTAVAMGQRVVLPPGAILTFVLSQPPAASGAAPAPPAVAVASAASAPQLTPPSSAPPAGSAAAAAPGQDWWLCRYPDAKDPLKPGIKNLMYYAVLPSSAATASTRAKHFGAYVWQNYKVSGQVYDNGTSAGNASGYCTRLSNDATTRANSMDMYLKQWASSSIEAIRVNWSDTPAEDAAIDAKLAGAASVAATAAATPTAAANQNYVWCNSAWGGTAGTMMPAGTVMYFSDVFPADMPPPPTATPGHPLSPNSNGPQINRINALQTSFFVFLQKKYGYKDAGNYPVDCRTGYPPGVAGLQSAQKYKQQFEDEAKRNRGQIVETGWKE